MPSRNPRINIVVDPQVYEQIKQLAERRGVSISMAARDLIRDALVMEEDADLAELAVSGKRRSGRTWRSRMKRLGDSPVSSR